MKESDFSALTYILTDMTKGELQEAAAFFGVKLRPSDRKAVMVKRLETAYRTDMIRCLKRLPIYELRNLQLLVAQGKGVKMLIPEPLPPFFSYMFGLLEDDYLPENDDLNSDWDELMRIYFEDEVFDLVAPVRRRRTIFRTFPIRRAALWLTRSKPWAMAAMRGRSGCTRSGWKSSSGAETTAVSRTSSNGS